MTRREAEAILDAELLKHGLPRKVWYRTIYLHSEHWKTLRLHALDHHGRKCHNCPSTRFLDVHHLRYSSIYDVTVDDLQILCRTCHDKEHAPTKHPKTKAKLKKSTRKPTLGRKVGKATKRTFHGTQEEQLAQIRNLLANSQGLTTGDFASLTKKKRRILRRMKSLRKALRKK